MLIILNNDPCEVEHTRLDQVLLELGYNNAAIATAVNSSIVHKHNRCNTQLNENDRLEIVSPIGGG